MSHLISRVVLKLRHASEPGAGQEGSKQAHSPRTLWGCSAKGPEGAWECADHPWRLDYVGWLRRQGCRIKDPRKIPRGRQQLPRWLVRASQVRVARLTRARTVPGGREGGWGGVPGRLGCGMQEKAVPGSPLHQLADHLMLCE